MPPLFWITSLLLTIVISGICSENIKDNEVFSSQTLNNNGYWENEEYGYLPYEINDIRISTNLNESSTPKETDLTSSSMAPEISIPEEAASTSQQSTSEAPESSSAGPEVSTSEAPESSSSVAPEVSTSEAPESSSSVAPEVSTSEAPESSSAGPEVSTSEAPESSSAGPEVSTSEAPESSSSVAEVSTTEEPQESTSPAPNCSSGAKFMPYPGDCNKFIQCSNGVEIIQRCPSNLFWNPIQNGCGWSSAYCPDQTTIDPNLTEAPGTTCRNGANFLPHPSDCTKYIQCANGVEIIQSCPKYLYWNPRENICGWTSEFCEKKVRTSTCRDGKRYLADEADCQKYYQCGIDGHYVPMHCASFLYWNAKDEQCMATKEFCSGSGR